MLGLFERIGEGLEMLAMPISAAGSYVNCAVQNFATDVRTEAKCRQIDREAKRTSSCENIKESYLKDIEKTLANAKDLSADDIMRLHEKSEAAMKETKVQVEEAIKSGDAKKIEECQKLIGALDILGNLCFSMRTETASMLQQATPIFQQPVGAPLHEQAAQQGGVTAMDIINNLRGQDIQHANPQGINNPIPTQA